MTDRKPPRFAAGDAETLLALLQYQRESLARKIEGADEAAARHSPVASGTTLLWLAKHLAQAEATWVLVRFAGQDPSVVPDPAVGPDDTVAGALSAYRAMWERVDEVVATAGSLDELCAEQPPTNLRWVLAHLLEETARHAGHADILREMMDGSTGR